MCWNCWSRFGFEAAGELLVVDPQRVAHRLEQSRDGLRADVDPEPAEFVGELGGRAACPLQTADGVPGRFVGHQGFDAGDDFGRFFFRRCSSAARAPHPVDLDIALDELPAAGGDRGGVDADEGGDAPVAAPPALERFESGEQPALALVEEAGEQHDGGAQLLGHHVGVGQGPPESGRGHQQPSGAELMGLLRVVGRAVEELAGELVPRQPPVGDELAQGVLGADTEPVVELVDEVSGFRVVDERLGGCDEGAGAGEADAGERPQAVFVEVGELVEGVVAAAMGVAGAGVEVPELAERGAPADSGTEGGHHVGQGSATVCCRSRATTVSAENWVGLICGTITDS